ncbi:tetratricopeptide repeat protein [Pseudanabaena sp. UWO311]|uniref:CHAT domain-containing protein n=1 Tax=Pseudanabaena sp. UWO311 TaxID=2487337 RepID=UPI00115844A0|nr:CHAT domain-containing protein [Pseudanabaena sp. UWO311]TYQ27200.1 tetratricopeptide repeat protein [Pseudanabaena sp. UWO311]
MSLRKGFGIVALVTLLSWGSMQGMFCELGWTQAEIDRKSQADGLNQLGIFLYQQKQLKEALSVFQQVLAIRQQIKDRAGAATVLSSIGTVYLNLGQYPEALDYYQQYLASRVRSSDRSEEGTILNNIGLVYDNLGQYSKALEYYQQALAISKEVKNRAEEFVTLNNIGTAYLSRGEYSKALKYYQQSLTIKKSGDDLSLERVTFNNIGLVFRSLKQYPQALDYYQKALAISKELNDRSGEATVHNNLGVVYDELGQYAKALVYYQQALEIVKATGDRTGEAKTLNNIGIALDSQLQPEMAILFFKQSVIVRESIRKDLKKLSREEQQIYTLTVADTYRVLTDLLLRQGRVTEALQVLDLLKIQELEDYLKNVNGSDRTSQSIRLLEPERAINAQLIAFDHKKLPDLNQKLAKQIRQLPEAEINEIPEYLRKIPKGAVLIYPLILNDRLELIIFSANSFPINHSISIKKEELKVLVTDFRADLQDHSSEDVKMSSKKLYDVLIKPIELELNQANANTILYAPDDLFRYIPLAALYDGRQYLVEKYRINNLIAYSLFDSDKKLLLNPRIFAGAFGGRDKETKFGQNALPASIYEVEHIANIFPNTNKYIEQNFTSTVAKEKVAGNSIVHFATHAEFKSGSPLDSYVLFGDGSKITLAEISDLPLKDTELVVLSACQTGLSSILGTGAEILGFGYQVQRAGTKASIASLWSVSDGGTQLLMQEFYQKLQKGNIAPSTALREAQLSMIHRHIKDGKTNYNHPFFWSAFVVIGNGL